MPWARTQPKGSGSTPPHPPAWPLTLAGPALIGSRTASRAATRCLPHRYRNDRHHRVRRPAHCRRNRGARRRRDRRALSELLALRARADVGDVDTVRSRADDAARVSLPRSTEPGASGRLGVLVRASRDHPCRATPARPVSARTASSFSLRIHRYAAVRLGGARDGRVGIEHPSVGRTTRLGFTHRCSSATSWASPSPSPTARAPTPVASSDFKTSAAATRPARPAASLAATIPRATASTSTSGSTTHATTFRASRW